MSEANDNGITYTATYSPEDNKLRLYASSRLDAETYQRAKRHGFCWAPKQELFVAPAWTPDREDFLLGLAGEIDDEDTTLADRAEAKAERLENLSERRATEAERTRESVERLADGIPLGQPILIGHHSEKRARKDAEKIQNGTAKAVRLWRESKYWTDRAAGALANAKYKELPGVRARRIKTLEAELRKVQRSEADRAKLYKAWEAVKNRAQALHLANYCHLSRCFTLAEYPRNLPASQYEGSMGLWSALGGSEGEDRQIITWEQAREIALKAYADGGPESYTARWIEHLNNRLAYERAMLAEGGGLVSDRHNFAPGGQVLRRGEWYVISKVNPGSVSVLGHFAPTITHDEIKDYRPPTDEAAAAVAKVSKVPPLCNYPGEGFKHMTKAELETAHKGYQWAPKIQRIAATATTAAHRLKQVPDRSPGKSSYATAYVYVTDLPRRDPPPAVFTDADREALRKTPAAPRETASPTPGPTPETLAAREEEKATAAKFEAMADGLRKGVVVQVVSAPQLFPTPPELARRMVEEEAGISPAEAVRVLEPSAGTGNLLRAIYAACKPAEVVAVEINSTLAGALAKEFPQSAVRCADFLELSPDDLGLFDFVLMNPPFGGAADIEHIQHARKFLKPDGLLLSICANGPRQRAAFYQSARLWQDLPAGTFKDSGTGVNTALVHCGLVSL